MTTGTFDRLPAARAGTLILGGQFTVNRIGFGALHLAGAGSWGEPRDREACRKLLWRVMELGVNFIDTADSYGPEVSERIICEALRPYPKGLVIATKGGHVRPNANRWDTNGRPEHLRRACEGSLRRLGIDTIDLYQFHRPDPAVPFEESLGAIVDLRNEGKVRLIGISNVSSEQLRIALNMADIASVQNLYNVSNRQSEPVLKICEQRGIVFIAYGPFRRDADDTTGNLISGEGILRDLAATRGLRPAPLALAWLLERSPMMLPIPGTSSADHLEQNVGAAAIELDNEVLVLLERAEITSPKRPH